MDSAGTPALPALSPHSADKTLATNCCLSLVMGYVSGCVTLQPLTHLSVGQPYVASSDEQVTVTVTLKDKMPRQKECKQNTTRPRIAA